MVTAGPNGNPARWQEAFENLMGRVAGRFARVEPRRRMRKLVLGLLSDLPRKNCWTIAEWAGDTTPDGMQHLLGRAKWDADQVRDDIRSYVVEHLHDDQAVLVVDETGDVKKGTGTVGVQRQYTGTAGRIENSQVAVYLVYAGQRGHAAVDRELYVPRSWTSDSDRCRAAGLAEKTTWPHSTSTRSAATPPGPAGSPSPCSRTPSSPSYAQTSTPAPHPMPSSRSPATRSSACSSPSSSAPSTMPPTGSVGPTGGAATRPDPRPATTGDKPLRHEDHDLRLEY